MAKSLASRLLLVLLPTCVPNAVLADEQTDLRIGRWRGESITSHTRFKRTGLTGLQFFCSGPFPVLGHRFRQECVVVVFSRAFFQRHHGRCALGEKLGGS